jgi:dTDP-4-amino-4,6-dideoxygalactose transaminase
MNVPLLDLRAQYRTIKAELDAAVAEVMESQVFILGPKVTACEEAVARYSQSAHGIGVTSGTDALLLALMAEGIGAGDEVITTPYTFFATAGCIARLGARPVFVDIDPKTFNLREDLIEAAITPRTRAIMPVHLYGRMARMDVIMEIAQRRQLVVIEDAAQAIGAEFKGQRAGSVGHYGCFSFFPSKNLGGAGDGGLITTQDPARADKLRWLRNHGMNPKYYHKMIGGNFRLDALQAAVVLVKLRHLDGWTEGRQKNAARYHRLFDAAGLAGREIQTPHLCGKLFNPESTCRCRHVINQYIIRARNRDGLLAHLQKNGIGCEIYYPLPLHLQECFHTLGYSAGAFPEAERAAQETLALPVYPELTDEQAQHVVATIAGFYAKN